MRRLMTLAVLICSTASLALADDGGGGGFTIKIIPERQEERRAHRWTIGDWFKTKKIMEDQDRWLAGHTNKNPFDLTYGLLVDRKRLEHDLDVFVLAFGLHFHYETTESFFYQFDPGELRNSSGDFGLQLRLFGGNPQNTNLVVKFLYEYDHVAGPSSVMGPYEGFGVSPELQIYLSNWLGMRGDWRYRTSKKRISQGDIELKGNSYSVVAFLEQRAVRVEFGWRSRSWNFKGASAATTANMLTEGLFGRLRVFF